MRILLDHGTPAPLQSLLAGHDVRQAKAEGWDTLSNGDLLAAAEASGYELLITTDKNLRYQQNLAGRTIAIAVLSNAQWPVLRRHVDRVVLAIEAAAPGNFLEIQIPD